jgi:hypothetical protein
MGTKLTIKGLPEGTFKIFAGGEKRGKCLQITTAYGAMFQLDADQVHELVEKLSAAGMGERATVTAMLPGGTIVQVAVREKKIMLTYAEMVGVFSAIAQCLVVDNIKVERQ